MLTNSAVLFKIGTKTASGEPRLRGAQLCWRVLWLLKRNLQELSRISLRFILHADGRPRNAGLGVELPKNKYRPRFLQAVKISTWPPVFVEVLRRKVKDAPLWEQTWAWHEEMLKNGLGEIPNHCHEGGTECVPIIGTDMFSRKQRNNT